jgi:hypothetical protein
VTVLLRHAMTPSKERSIVGQAIASVLAIYDPTLDAYAEPTYFAAADVVDFYPCSFVDHNACSEYNRMQYTVHEFVSDGDVITRRLRCQDLRVVLDGRPVRGAIEASKSGGWVRFLAMRPNDDGSMTPYAHRGPDGMPTGIGAVTGIAFGKVEWLMGAGITHAVDDGG